MSLKKESEGASTWWEKVKNFLKWFIQKENILMLLGASIALTAVAVPFAIIHFTKTSYTMKSFEDLGVIGDFFGGTTVGLLSLASIIFVTAAVMMQKEELKLQREEVKKTREEYEVTNATMKRQQFDSTFFNMINLHHNILKEITHIDSNQAAELTGRSVIAFLLRKVKESYQYSLKSKYKEDLKKSIISYEDTFTRNDLLLKSEVFNAKKKYISELSRSRELLDYDFDKGEVITDKLDSIIADIQNDSNEIWIEKKRQIVEDFNEKLIVHSDYVTAQVEAIDFAGMINSGVSHLFLNKYKNDIFVDPLRVHKVQAYEAVYKKYENKIGHYYRNLYRIIRLIQDENFEENVEKNEMQRKKYRGILRAQLSSSELMMLFYNVTYSTKGEKFRDYLINTNFFDDHLIQSQFIWVNDKEELKLIN
ncbi:putative phage abortive infection protein [Paenibacillus amylolyticus]|uniref:putative phage abortive infection protein n=1 Tax=Paenibacillus amylolyticus TaxID=1451 RepID=UPI003D97C728